jgi:multidrug efflux system membrane fusion protein
MTEKMMPHDPHAVPQAHGHLQGQSQQPLQGVNVAAPPVPTSSGVGKWVWVVLGIAVVGGAGLWVRHSSQQKNAAAGPAPSGSAAAGARPVPVVAATVEEKDVPIYVEGVGNATPIQQVVVHPQVDGLLAKVFFTEGQTVKAGEVIAQIDPRPFDIALHNSQAALVRDNAQAKEAKVNLDRYQQMVKEGIASQQQVDDQKALAEQLGGTVATDAAAIAAANLNLDYARIKSPLDGVTGIRQVDPGNVIHQADVNGLVVVTQIDPMAVIFSLPQDDLERVQAALGAGEVEVDAFSRDGAVTLGKGKLALIDNQINTTTATLRLKAIVPNADKKLWPNQFVKARVLLRTQEKAVVAPAVAVQRGPQGQFVYVIGADGTVQPRPVEIQSQQGELAVIAKGLNPGERVVTDGANQLRPGTKVSTKAGDAKKKGNAPGVPGAPGAAASGTPSAAPAEGKP